MSKRSIVKQRQDRDRALPAPTAKFRVSSSQGQGHRRGAVSPEADAERNAQKRFSDRFRR
jgi:hypothetical protein